MNFEFSLIFKSSVLLLIAAILAGLFRRRSASNCYVIWAAGLIAILVLPVVSMLLPEVNLRILPNVTAPVAPTTTLRLNGADRSAEATSKGTDSANSTTNSRAVKSFSNQWLLSLWATGAVVIVVRSLLGIRDVRRFKLNSSAVVDPDWNDLLFRLKRELGIASNVELRFGDDALPPMTWGIVRHTILFPRSAGQWPGGRIRDVMVHELSHVRRQDGLMQLFAQAACVVYWFNPLVWFAAYRLRIERERACDDHVLKLGANPEDYADHLLQIARSINAGYRLPTMSVTDHSGFEKRLRLVLDPKRNRQTFSRKSTVLVVCWTALLTALLGNGHLAARPTQASTPKWAGTWKLNKSLSKPMQDSRVLEMFNSTQTATVKLETAQGSVKVTTEVVAGPLNQKLTMQSTIPLGVPINLNDIPIFLRNPGATALPGGTVTVTSIADESLQIQLQWDLGGRTVIQYDVSTDGNTLTVSVPAPDFTRMVFERQ
jgi:beta-lactamase regulating signal transducer with metallopeptidase domain